MNQTNFFAQNALSPFSNVRLSDFREKILHNWRTRSKLQLWHPRNVEIENLIIPAPVSIVFNKEKIMIFWKKRSKSNYPTSFSDEENLEIHGYLLKFLTSGCVQSVDIMILKIKIYADCFFIFSSLPATYFNEISISFWHYVPFHIRFSGETYLYIY